MSDIQPTGFDQPSQPSQTPNPKKEDGTFTKIAKKFANIFGAEDPKNEENPPSQKGTWHRR